MVDRQGTFSDVVPWIVAIMAVMALVGMLAFARGEPGDDGRAPEAQRISSGAPAAGPEY